MQNANLVKGNAQLDTHPFPTLKTRTNLNLIYKSVKCYPDRWTCYPIGGHAFCRRMWTPGKSLSHSTTKVVSLYGSWNAPSNEPCYSHLRQSQPIFLWYQFFAWLSLPSARIMIGRTAFTARYDLEGHTINDWPKSEIQRLAMFARFPASMFVKAG